MDVSGPTGPTGPTGERPLRPLALPDRPLEAPRRFRVHRCLGRGGFGEVYRATMSREGGVTSEVAIKILAADVDPGSDAVVRLRDEGRLLGALSHPAILHVYDLVLLAGRVALVAEYVEGQDLHRVLFGPDAMPLRARIEAVGQVAEALHAAWNTESPYGGGAMNLVHRDVKPQNVRVGVHGQVKLLDFGIARAANVQREANTQTNLLLGSWPYLAPERLLDDDRSPAPSVDVYALGCTLFEGLVGERLMEGRKLMDLYRAVEEPDGWSRLLAPRLALARVAAPAPVFALLEEMLRTEPALRPSAEQVAHRCEDLAESLPGVSIRRWARERAWPPPDEFDGPLTDYELTEGGLEIPAQRAAPRSTPAPAPPRSTPAPAVSRPTPRPPAPTPSPAVPRAPAPPPPARGGSSPVEPALADEPALPSARAAAHARAEPEMDLGSIRLDEPDEPTTRSSGRSAVPLGVGLGLAAFGVAALGALAVLVGGAWWLLSPSAAPPPAAAPVEAAPVEPAPVEAAPVEAAPVEAAPVEAAPVEAAPVEPAPVESGPAPAAPRPPPAPPRPAPPPPDAFSALRVRGDATVELRGEFGGFRAGTPSLPPGTYEVWADFGQGFVDTGARTEARPGVTVVVSCVAAGQACSVRP